MARRAGPPLPAATQPPPVRDPQAPRREPRRDRAARVPRLPRARDRDGRGRARRRRRLAARARGGRDRRDPSYLDAEEHVRAAKEAGADAIHPGYGFLAESADFAEAVEAAGLVLVGPPPEALAAGGDKLEAKRIAREAGVPVVPEGEPDEVGFPLMIKAAAGGGGRGMRVVARPAELERGARGRAARGGGGVRRRPRLLRALRRAAAARRDPAARRRARQRDRARRARVLGAAPPPEGARGVAVARARRGAARADERRGGRASRARSATAAPGTAEFMLDGRDFWFLELNGRIQVEHPVTELVTGVDLVAGAAPDRAGRAAARARAVACAATRSRCGSTPRIRARSCRRPAGSSGCGCRPAIRVDAGVEEGDEVGIALRPDDREADRARPDARGGARPARGRARRDRGRRASSRTCPFLRWLVAHPALRAGETTTAFLTDYPPLSAPPLRLPDRPWRGGFRLNLPAPPPAPPPDVDAAAHDARPAARSRARSPRRCPAP